MVHMDMASSILRALFDKDIPRSDKKVLCQALSKLFLPLETDDDDRVRTLKLLVHNLRTRRPPRDASAQAALVKFDGVLSKRFEKQLEDFNEAEYRQLQSLQELFEFLDDIVPVDEDEDEEGEVPTAKKRAARKRRSESVTTDSTSTAGEWARNLPRAKSGKAKSKRRRTSQSGDEEDGDDVLEGSPPSAIPTRTMPRRAATKKVDMTPIRLEGDEDDNDGAEDDNDRDTDEDEEDRDRRLFLVPCPVQL